MRWPVRYTRRSILLLVLVLLAVMLLILHAAPTRAATYPIANGDVTSLANALRAASQNGDPDMIVLATNGIYNLTVIDGDFSGALGLPTLHGQITIDGNGATIQRSTASGTPGFRIFAIDADATVQINNLTIANGAITGNASSPDASGGGIYNNGTLTLTGVTVAGNSARASDGGSTPNGGVAMGGGIASSGMLLLNNSIVRNNSVRGGDATGSGAGGDGFGGGISSLGGAVQLHGSSILSNTISAGAGAGDVGGTATGGGIYTAVGPLLVDRSTIRGNIAQGGAPGLGNGGIGAGGGIYNNGTLTLQNSTISTNGVGGERGRGGGIYNQSGATTASSSTIVYNQASGTVSANGGGYEQNVGSVSLTFKNTIIAWNTAATGPDCHTFAPIAQLISQGYNLVGNSSNCLFVLATGDQRGTAGQPRDPLLDPLQSSDAISYYPLHSGSPAIDAGNPSGCTDAQGTPLTIDQRGVGFPRSRDGDGNGVARCDIGAFELQSSSMPPTATSRPTQTPTNTSTATATATGTPPTATATVKPASTATVIPPKPKYRVHLPLVVR